MKTPRYKKDIFVIIFLFIGLAFIIFGLLSFANIIRPTAHSQVQDHNLMGLIFCIIGLIFFITQGILRYLSFREVSIHRELISKGTKVKGTIKRIVLQKSIKYGGKSPYVLFYTYTYEGKDIQSKSSLFWEKPRYHIGDQIEAFVDESGNSALDV